MHQSCKSQSSLLWKHPEPAAWSIFHILMPFPQSLRPLVVRHLYPNDAPMMYIIQMHFLIWNFTYIEINNDFFQVISTPTIMSLAILVSTLTIVTQMAISHAIRVQLARLLTHELLKEVMIELVATAELCGTCFELCISKSEISTFLYFWY